MEIERELKMALKSLNQRVTVHQMETKRAKSLKLPSKEDLQDCLSAAAKKIPKLLGKFYSTVTIVLITT